MALPIKSNGAPPALASTFTGAAWSSVDVDLVAARDDARCPPTFLWVFNGNASAQSVVLKDGKGVDFSMKIPAGQQIPLDVQATAIDTATHADIEVTAFYELNAMAGRGF